MDLGTKSLEGEIKSKILKREMLIELREQKSKGPKEKPETVSSAGVLMHIPYYASTRTRIGIGS